MPAPFAALEARSAAACFRLLANSTALLDGLPVDGVFDAPYSQAFDGIATAEPRFSLLSAAASAATQASLLVVQGVTYRVRSVQPNSTGVTALILARQ